MINLSDGDSLLESKQRLVENSSVFSYIILECYQLEHDISDFTPEIVEMILNLLQDQKVEHMKNQNLEKCLKFPLSSISSGLLNPAKFGKDQQHGRDCGLSESLVYLFSEFYHIYCKWKQSRFMEAMISKVCFKVSKFVSKTTLCS